MESVRIGSGGSVQQHPQGLVSAKHVSYDRDWINEHNWVIARGLHVDQIDINVEAVDQGFVFRLREWGEDGCTMIANRPGCEAVLREVAMHIAFSWVLMTENGITGGRRCRTRVQDRP